MSEKYCKCCGKPLVKKRYSNGCLETDLQLSKRTYCDRECMKKSFRGHKKEENLSWFTAHKRAREKVEKQKCEMCGRTENLDVHHKDGNEQNNNIDNLQILCRSCHMKMHRPKKICVVEGCGNPMKGHGYCNKHLQRFKKYGDPMLTNMGHGNVVIAKD